VSYLNARVRNRDFQLNPAENELRQVLSLCSPRGSVDAGRLRRQSDVLRATMQKAHMTWQQRWDINLEPLHRNTETLRFETLYDDLTKLLDELGRAEHPLNIFAYMAFQRQASAIVAKPAFEVLQTFAHMQAPLSKECLERTLRDPKDSREYRDYQRAYDTLQEMMNSGRS